MPATSLSSADANTASSSVTSATSTTVQGSNASLVPGAPVSTQPTKISKGVIAPLAVTGGVVVGIFIGVYNSIGVDSRLLT